MRLSSLLFGCVFAVGAGTAIAADVPEELLDETCSQEIAPELIWAAPAKNATDVPTNVQIILVRSYGSVLEVTLNDDALTPSGDAGIGRFIYRPAATLLPNTLYRIVGTFVAGATTNKFSRQFTTGAGPTSDTPIAVNIVGHGDSDLDKGQICGQLIEAQQCPKTNGNFISLQLNPAADLLLINHEEDGKEGPLFLWPVECFGSGFPADEPGMEEACLQVKALNAAGTESSSVSYCPQEDLPGSTDGGGGGGGAGARAAACTQSRGPVPGRGVGWLSIVFFGILMVISRVIRFASR
jgi:hypothetical protein